MYIEKLPNGKFRCGQSYKDFMTGKFKKVSVVIDRNTASKRKEAENMLQEMIDNLNKYDEKKDYSLKEVIEKYRVYLKTAVKPSTYYRNYCAGNTFMKIFGSDILVNNLNATFVREKLIDTGRKGSTLNESIIRFKTLLRWAYQEELIKDISWLDKIRPFPDIARRVKIADKYLEGFELKILLDNLTVEHNKRFYLFMALSGLRPGEAIALTVNDIDFENRIINVDKTYNSAQKIILSAKTETSEREVYMQDELFQFIKEQLSYNRHFQISTGIRTDLLFFNKNGGYLQHAGLNKYFKDNCVKHLNRKLTLHSLRHTHASLMFEHGMSLDAISERLGHNDSSITKEVYLHITNKTKERYNNTIKEVHIL